MVEDRTFHFIFRQPLHDSGGLLVQSATVEILRDRVHAASVDRLDGMIVCKLSLLSAFQITDLAAGASTLVTGAKPPQYFVGLAFVVRNQRPQIAHFLGA